MKVIALLCVASFVNGMVPGMSGSVKTSIISAAGKLLQGQSSSKGNSVGQPPATKKPSKMSKIMDFGTNAAIAVAGAGSIYQALSSNFPSGSPSTIAPVSNLENLLLFLVIYLFVRSIF